MVESERCYKDDKTKDRQGEMNTEIIRRNENVKCEEGLEVSPRRQAEDEDAGGLRAAETMHGRSPQRSQHTLWPLDERVRVIGPHRGVHARLQRRSLAKGTKEDPQKTKSLRGPGMKSLGGREWSLSRSKWS